MVGELSGLRGKRIALSGAAGFIGANVARTLIDQGAELTLLEYPGAKLDRLEATGLLVASQLNLLDLTDFDRTVATVRELRPQIFFHLAAVGVRGGAAPEAKVIAGNVLMGASVAKACASCGVERLIWLGSAYEYRCDSDEPLAEDHPLGAHSTYALAKTSAWEFARYYTDKSGTSLITARAFNIYGPLDYRMRIVPYAICGALDGTPVELNSSAAERDWLHVEDAASALLLLSTAAKASGVYNVCGGSSISVLNLAQKAIEASGGAADIVQRTPPAGFYEPPRVVGDNSKLKALGWEPRYTLDSGLRSTASWVKENRGLLERLRD